MSYTPPVRNQYPNLLKRTASVFVVIVTLISLVVVAPSYKTVKAGLVSFISSLMGSEDASADIGGISVSKGDSQSIALLQAHTNIQPTREVVAEIVPLHGGKVLVPDLALANSTSTSSYNTQISIYTVREGDTISGVAQMFNVSMNTVLWANDLTSKSILKPGQTLVILPISGVNYTIKKGDTIGGIAKQFGADIEDVLNYNDVTISSTLVVGNTLLIPAVDLSPSQLSAVSGSTASGVSGSGISSSKQPSYPGYYACPAKGRLSQGIHGHNGIDIASPVGSAVYASAHGKVIISRSNGAWNGGYGNFVVISHDNGTQTLYSHLSKVSVSAGQTVSSGQTIGLIGMTGLTTGPHVHFEVRGAKNPFTSDICR